MSIDQATAVDIAAIVSTADGHCGPCAFALLAQCADKWPKVDWAQAMADATDEWGDVEEVAEMLADH